MVTQYTNPGTFSKSMLVYSRILATSRLVNVLEDLYSHMLYSRKFAYDNSIGTGANLQTFSGACTRTRTAGYWILVFRVHAIVLERQVCVT